VRIQVGDRRLFFDVDGAKLVPEGPWMRERPTVVLLHPGPGFDHLLFKIQLGPWLAQRSQVVYLDQRGGGRSDGAEASELRLERWADDVRELCDALTIERPVVLGMGFGALVALDYASRHPSHPGALVLVGPVARIVPERSIAVYERLGGQVAAAAGRGFYEQTGDQVFADFLRVCFPLLSRSELTADVIIRADWNPEALTSWMTGEARAVDLRERLGQVQAPALVLAGEEDAWAPLESVREVVDGLGGETVFRSFPEARHSIFLDAPEAYDVLEQYLAGLAGGAP
jgi:pimeloyl-ACP methyl ester carboxylesterase